MSTRPYFGVPTCIQCSSYAARASRSSGSKAATTGGTMSSTASPKGILHTTGGYLLHTSTTHRLVFDLKPDTDVFWTAADIGWVTGHSYIVYGPLCNGTTSVMYEGTPDAGGRDRWWRIIEEFGVTILYTAPTTIRTLMKWGEEHL